MTKPPVQARGPYDLAQTAARAVPGATIAGLGVVMLVLAQSQPAWLGADVGPGLMARVLALGVIALGVAWALVRALVPAAATDNLQGQSAGCAGTAAQDGLPYSAPALLGAVAVFALALPFAGLILSSGFAAAIAAWGAGERTARAMGGTVLGLMVFVGVIAGVLLPPTAPLWPWR